METVTQTVSTKNRLLIKALIIGGIALILQIPTFYVQNLVEERESRQKEAVTEVSSKWAKKQIVAGPLLVLPYWENADSTKTSSKHYAYFLPDELNVNSTITPEEKHRGIYKVMLYNSRNNISGAFANLPVDKLRIAPDKVIWNEAFVEMNISDIKGLNDELRLKWNDNVLIFSQNGVESNERNLTAPLNISNEQELKNISFSTEINLSGSEQLLFTPVGKSTTVNMYAKWPHPSFTGDVLPINTKLTNDSFFATWKSVTQKRNFPQQWKDNTYTITDSTFDRSNINASAFGANLFVPVNGYQKTMRSVKYAALCILLTFAAFFLIEITNKKSVHPFHYGLIGLALVLFYTLLLSFSEYIGFDVSYIVASICTIGLIAWFVKSILSSAKSTTILSIVLALLYAYVFTILQLQDYSLLLGSIGLFVTLAVIMQFSKKIQWQHSSKNNYENASTSQCHHYYHHYYGIDLRQCSANLSF